MKVPRVTIGLPVRNGEPYLEQALASILGQSFEDLELVVCDNASTDRTAVLCLDHAARDPRLRYLRNHTNLGAAANYNRCFAMARGAYFKWAAHDDVLAPRFVERCLEVLERERDAVLCQSLIEVVDARGLRIRVYDSDLRGSDARRPSARFATLVLRPHRCNEFFGLIRRGALERSLLHGSYHGADRALLAQLALRGRFLQWREPLLAMRQHPGQYSQAVLEVRERSAWHAAGGARLDVPTLRLYATYWGLLRREAMPAQERLACAAHLARWWLANWNWARVLVDAAALVTPGATRAAERLKQRAFSPAPGRFPE